MKSDRQLLKIDDVSVLADPLPKEAPKYAVVLLADDEWHGKKPIFSGGRIVA